MVGMGVRLLAGSFEPVNRDVINREFQPRQMPVEASNFDGAAGDRLQGEDQLLPHVLAKQGAVQTANGGE